MKKNKQPYWLTRHPQNSSPPQHWHSGPPPSRNDTRPNAPAPEVTSSLRQHSRPLRKRCSVAAETAGCRRCLRRGDHDGEEVFPGEAAQAERAGGGRCARGPGPGASAGRYRGRLRERRLLRGCGRRRRQWRRQQRRRRGDCGGRRGTERAPKAEEHRLVLQRLGLRAAGACLASRRPPEQRPLPKSLVVEPRGRAQELIVSAGLSPGRRFDSASG